jgi:hypothetical protein
VMSTRRRTIEFHFWVGWTSHLLQEKRILKINLTLNRWFGRWKLLSFLEILFEHFCTINVDFDCFVQWDFQVFTCFSWRWRILSWHYKHTTLVSFLFCFVLFVCLVSCQEDKLFFFY